ncbi:MAG TPA: arsenite methyltransferase [Candidatus Limnocylindrales bacterium]|nr:arsenite methyltransferase [Candidatus Limnocylindrales bacterium]
MTTELEPIQATTPGDEVHDAVRARYAEAALAVAGSATAAEAASRSGALNDCCGEDGSRSWGSLFYADADRASLPDAAVLASLGCGNPVAVAELREGETVLDLGSGGGIDVLLSARRVGPTGRAIGIDMTDEMLELARRNTLEAGATNVEFRKGTIEALPLDADSVDVVISNCVINLAADKGAVFTEIARVLREGGRMGVSDVVADDSLTPAERAERGSYAGCIAGALSFSEYRYGLEAAGLTDVSLEPTHSVGDGLYSAIVRARKPAGWTGTDATRLAAALPSPATTRNLAMLDGAGCCGGEGCC